MKTTVEIPDSLYRRLKARAALQGQTIKDFLIDAVQTKLAEGSAKRAMESGWRAVAGKADPKDVQAVQKIIDEEFSRIDPKDWE